MGKGKRLIKWLKKSLFGQRRKKVGDSSRKHKCKEVRRDAVRPPQNCGMLLVNIAHFDPDTSMQACLETNAAVEVPEANTTGQVSNAFACVSNGELQAVHKGSALYNVFPIPSNRE